MGNEQGQEGQQGQDKIESSRDGKKQNKVSHLNTHGYKSPPIIYEAISVAGPALRGIEVNDLNNYIHTKAPNPRNMRVQNYSREEDYAAEEGPAGNLISTMKLYQNDPQHKPFFKLKLDDEGGVANELTIHHFDYDKKLRHFIEKPTRNGHSQIPS